MAGPSNARLWYRIFLNVAAPLVVAATLAEISVAQGERRARASEPEAFDATDVLEEHGIEVGDVR